MSFFCFVFSSRWATQGFDFLQAIEPAFISALPEDDFLVKLLPFFYFIFNNSHAKNVLSLSLSVNVHSLLQNLQALMNECIGHVIGKPHSPVTGLYIGKILLCNGRLLEFRIDYSLYSGAGL